MGFLSLIFGKRRTSETMKAKHFTEEEIKQINEDFMVRLEQAKNLFIANLELYNEVSCQCAYPRFQQIIGIDCTNTGHSYKCFDTDLLIDLSAEYFDKQKSEHTDECTNEKWVCKKCGSSYEYGWSDFSLYVERQKLRLKSLVVDSIGKDIETPIPLYLGLQGHSYPPKENMKSVPFDEFAKYLNEE